MPDLTLRDALEQYPDVCREVLGQYFDETDCPDNEEALRIMAAGLIGFCHMWLAGKDSETVRVFGQCSDWHEKQDHYIEWSDEPLRFALEEVKAQMEEA